MVIYVNRLNMFDVYVECSHVKLDLILDLESVILDKQVLYE